MTEKINFVDICKDTVLANSFFTTMVQDNQDYVWLATNLGLARYDGYDFKLFNPYSEQNKPKDFLIECMYLLSDERLTLFTSKPEVFEFNITEESFKLLKSPFLNSTFNHNNIVKDKNDNYWVGTEANGLFRLDKDLNLIKHYKKKDLPDNNTVNSNNITFLIDNRKNDLLYIGTDNKGINIYDPSTNLFSYLEYDKNIPDSISSDSIRDMYLDTKQSLWVCTTRGLNLLNEATSTFKRYLINPDSEEGSYENVFNAICEDGQGSLLIGTHINGLICFDPASEKFKKTDANKYIPRCIFCLKKDKSNVVWLSALSGSISIINCLQKKFFQFDINFGESEDSVTAIHEDVEKNLWIGSLRNGLFKATRDNANSLNLIKQDESAKHSINELFESAGKFLFINCNGYGVYRIDMRDNSKRFFDKNIFNKFINVGGLYVFCSCIDRLNKNLVWISLSCQNLVIFNLETETIEKNDLVFETLKGIPVIALYMDLNNILWIGTMGSGLYKYDTVQNTITNYREDGKNKNGISENLIYSIAGDSNNNLWIGTEYGGLNMLEQNSNDFKKFMPEINSPMVSILLDNSENLWISTLKGILKYDVRKSLFHYFSESDGLLKEGYYFHSRYKSGDGKFYFGGKNGITYFKPEEITTNEYIPNIEITDFEIFYESVKPDPENPFLKKSISYAKEITLSYKESVITFRFAALIYNNPKKNEFAYKMEGFDADWVYCGTRRTATYMNLDPGEYTFRVKGSNNDGLWNEEGTSIKVMITPPWYKTMLFKGLVGLSLIGSAGSFYRSRIQKLKKEKTQQEEFTKKLIESQENERKRVAAELHDSLGQDLLIIKNKLLTNIKKSGDEKYREQLQEISELTSSTLDDVREISYNLRPYELDRLGLTKTIISMIGRANSSTNISFTGNINDIDKIFEPEVEINIYRILQESLNNVIKHSKAKEVIVSVLKKEKEISINIIDDGRGFDIRKFKQNLNRNGFGLKGIEERVRLFDGEFIIESDGRKGTQIKIIIPVRLQIL